MKKLCIVLFVCSGLLWAKPAPFNKGVNLTNWYQVSNSQAIQFTKFTRQDFENIKSLGADVIRLPINLHSMTNGAPDYIVDPLFFSFLDETIDITEDLGLHLILDNHTFSPSDDTVPEVEEPLIAIWPQMAEHFKNRSDLIYYEVLNEPHGIADDVWNGIQQRVLEAIRAVDTKHTIIVGPANWNSYNNLDKMPVYDDDNLIYTYHFYDPFLFTHQGATWTNPSMGPLSGVPFPYDADLMPDCPDELKGTWIEGNMNYTYPREGNEDKVKELLDIAISFGKERDVALLCGELGVYIPNSDNEQRVNWYRIVREYLEENGIAWTMWDYKGGFGLFNQGGNDMFNHDLNAPLAEALGFTPPEQTEYILQPDQSGFIMYSDYYGIGMTSSSSGNPSVINYYDTTDPANGNYCISWAGAGQYNQIGFDFTPNKDMSWLVDNGYVFDFMIKGVADDLSLDIRFIDTKVDSEDHPWRMKYTISDQDVYWDGNWNHVQIPLTDFTEHGSWDNGWFNPQGDFDWTAIDKFEIVTEHSELGDVKLYVDDVKVVDPNKAGVKSQIVEPSSFILYQNFPNPFNPTTQIHYKLNENFLVKLRIYNTLGRVVKTIVDVNQIAGEYKVSWNGLDDAGKTVPAGVYFYELSTKNYSQKHKMVLVK